MRHITVYQQQLKWIVLLWALSLPAPAADADPCVMAAKTQADINQCSTQRYKAADVALNRTYKEVRATLNRGQTTKLKQAQRAWLTFRDANCEAQAYDYAKGSLYTSVYTDCLAAVTRQRTAELKRVYLHLDGSSHIEEQQLAGTWRALENSYGLEISFGIDNGIHHYLSRLNGMPYEAGQWQLTDNQLSITANNGKLLHTYTRLQLDSGVLSLYEADGGVERFKKIQ